MTRSSMLRRAALATTCLAALGVAGVAMRAPVAEASVSSGALRSPSTETAEAPEMGQLATCVASWYGAVGEIPEGWPTASGEPFHRLALKAAHNSFKFGTKVKVTYQGKSVTVTINDRGGFGAPRCLDLTYGAFTKIANPDLGIITVNYEVVP
ncbi:septal ring lytic transglycosylase RlpA family protein [Melittangium boletus]|uniref:septal ring lytic transglycosylase RlpA family protein n=1 Tax=Melittangium boletus TaxID=83453 RepID=UPI003DA276E2